MTNRQRRAFLGTSLGGLAAFWIARPGTHTAVAAAPDAASMIDIEDFAADGHSLGVRSVPKVVKSEAEWRAQLSPIAYEVARREGTEPPFSGAYASNHADGLYRCICCASALFDSSTKFESGTGWPSFFRPISRHNLLERRDLSYGMVREAVACRRCDAHLGHVFDDGPRPTGLRYCMNSVALHFVPRVTTGSAS